jgi:ectoine hydroxylase-related dioxygenase (phytanoyl-CoA dioxygenase family)
MLRPQYLGSDQVDHLSIKIDPEPGMLVVFNGYLRHSCTANNIDEERISVSANFNIKLKPE